MTDLARARLEAIADALEYQGTVQDAALVRRLARVSEKRQTAGWKLVPKVATEDMLIALGEAVMRRRTGRMDLQELAEGWTAALSSAPQPNAAPQVPEGVSQGGRASHGTKSPAGAAPSDKSHPTTVDGPIKGSWATRTKEATEFSFLLTQWAIELVAAADEESGVEDQLHHSAEALKLERAIVERYTPRAVVSARRDSEAIDLLNSIYMSWALHGIAPELEARIQELLARSDSTSDR